MERFSFFSMKEDFRSRLESLLNVISQWLNEIPHEDGYSHCEPPTINTFSHNFHHYLIWKSLDQVDVAPIDINIKTYPADPSNLPHAIDDNGMADSSGTVGIVIGILLTIILLLLMGITLVMHRSRSNVKDKRSTPTHSLMTTSTKYRYVEVERKLKVCFKSDHIFFPKFFSASILQIYCPFYVKIWIFY